MLRMVVNCSTPSQLRALYFGGIAFTCSVVVLGACVAGSFFAESDTGISFPTSRRGGAGGLKAHAAATRAALADLEPFIEYTYDDGCFLNYSGPIEYCYYPPRIRMESWFEYGVLPEVRTWPERAWRMMR